MGSVIQDIHRDFGEVREKLDNLDTILPLLKDLAKQKEIITENYFVENSNHGHGHEHFDVHSSNDSGFKDELLKRFSTVGVENLYETTSKIKADKLGGGFYVTI
ncbi:hypothetical protein CR513_30279, partial [Mucuna pruriens]